MADAPPPAGDEHEHEHEHEEEEEEEEDYGLMAAGGGGADGDLAARLAEAARARGLPPGASGSAMQARLSTPPYPLSPAPGAAAQAGRRR